MLYKMLFACVLVLSISMIACGAEATDSDAMQGIWLPETAVLAGEKFPDEVRKNIQLVVKEDKYTVTAGKFLDQGTVKLDQVAKPKGLELVGTEGPNKGKTMLAIYELDGNTLKVCYYLSGKGRPTEFKSDADNKFFLVTYKREKR